MNLETETHLDITRLEKIRHVGSKITARCPACAAAGNDRSGNHLVILPSGKFGCAALPGDSEHRREIFSLVGIMGKRKCDPEREREWKQARKDEERKNASLRALRQTAKEFRQAIIDRHRWEAADVWESSPQRIDQPLVESDPRHFLDSLFPTNATIWTGSMYNSGEEGKHAAHWRTVTEWQKAERIGPMVAPATWPAGTISRNADNVLSSPFTILDFDGFDGCAPTTNRELRAHILSSLGIIRWLREGMHWQLAAMVWTGGKSIHAWFHTPPPDVLASLRTTAPQLGVDTSLLGRPEHPARLPGQLHEKTGSRSKVLWLQLPTH